MKKKNLPGPTGPGSFTASLAPAGTCHFITLGCKSNQYDSAAMADQLERAGMKRSGIEDSSVIVVNTCMVTGPTEAQCRKAVRQARRANPGARLLVTGCMSMGARSDLEAMEEVDQVIDPGDRGLIAGLLGLDEQDGWVDWPADAALDPGDRDRGLLKIQDGCDASCSYCIVPAVRGPSRSLEPDRVLGAVKRLMERGFGEVVLSGIHLGQYGKGLRGGETLQTLLERYLEMGLPGRLRLSSLEPLEITSGLLSTIAGAGERICRHLHIPLQSGSDRILAAMNRPYRRAQFVEAVERVRDAIPDAGIGCDVICGFPGETQEDFENTLDLVSGLELPFLHAFPYSQRPGTRAAAMKDDVSHASKKERVASLNSTASANRRSFAQSFSGKCLIVAVESRSDGKGRALALADNYLRVAVRGEATWSGGSLQRVLVTGAREDLLLAEPAGVN